MSRAFIPKVFGLALLLACGPLACGSTGEKGPQGQAAGSANAGTSGAGNGGGGGSANMPYDPSTGGPRLRVLTVAEYRNAITDLLGVINTELVLPADTFVGGFTAIGSAQVAINPTAVEQYETASRTAAAEVFADATRWQALVGCQPQADLSDACVASFVQKFGKRAWRRDLVDAEVQQWVQVGKDAAVAAASATHGLEAIVSGLLQSPYFLYRVETNRLDAVSGRLKYDGASMATRLSFLLTGRPPSEALLAAAAAGQLDSAEGVKAAAAPLLNDPGAADRMAVFFDEFARVDLVKVVQKSPQMFPEWGPALQTSMMEATRAFIKNVVLAPGADVRSFFDSDQTFVDATLAPIYGVPAPGSGFVQLTLGPETGRAGILGQAAVLAGHSQPDHNSPTRRGVFISETFLCTVPLPPPGDVVTALTPDPTKTVRQQLDAHRTEISCKGCHALFDPMGFALERFDSIGKFRDMENGQPIDTTGTLDGVAFDGAAQLGATLRGNARALTCMMSHFYRSSNGVLDATADMAQIDALTQTLAAKGYVWRDLVSEFVASDAFRSAPAAVTAGSQ